MARHGLRPTHKRPHNREDTREGDDARSELGGVVALALVLAGCTKSAPSITDEQVEGWKALAAETIPAATEITIDASTNATMAGTSPFIDTRVHFAHAADLKANDKGLVSFRNTVEEQAPCAAVDMTAVNDSAYAHGGEVSTRLFADVPGLTNAAVLEGTYRVGHEEGISMSGKVLLYVEDPAVIDPGTAPALSQVAKFSARSSSAYSVFVAMLRVASGSTEIVMFRY